MVPSPDGSGHRLLENNRWAVVFARYPAATLGCLAAALLFAFLGLRGLDVEFDLQQLYATSAGLEERSAAGQLVIAVAAGGEEPMFDELFVELTALDGVEAVYAPKPPPDFQQLPEEQRDALLRSTWGSKDDAQWQAVLVSLRSGVKSREVVPEIRKAVATAIPPGLETIMVGAPVMNLVLGEAGRAEQLRIIPVVFLVFAGLLAVVFRRPGGILLPLAAIGTSALLVAGFMGWRQVPLGGPTLLLLPLVLVLGLADSIHLLRRYSLELAGSKPPREALEKALTSVGSACFLTSFTTATGFLALSFTSSPILQTFGQLAAMGMLFALVAGLGLPAAVLTYFPSLSVSPRSLPPILEGPLGLLSRWVQGGRRLALGLVLLATVATGLVGAGINFDLKFNGELPDAHPARQDQERVDELLGGIHPLQIRAVTDGNSRTTDPAAFEELLILQRFLANNESVGSVISFADAILWVSRIAGHSPDAVTGSRRQLPFARKNRFKPYYLKADLLARQVSPVPLVSEDASAYLLWVRLHDSGARAWSGLLDAMSELDQERLERLTLESGGFAHVVVEARKQLAPDLIRVLLLTTLVTLVSMAAAFFSVRVALLSVIPLTLTVTTTLATMVVFNIPVGHPNLFVLSAALGLGVDALIHLIAAARERHRGGMSAAEACHHALVSSGASVSWTYLLLLAGLSTLLVSRMSSIREVAGVLLVAMTVNLLSTLVVFGAGGQWLLGEKD